MYCTIFFTLEMAVIHMSVEIELLPMYMTASIGLTAIVAVLGGINIALIAYNIKTQRNKNVKKSGTSAVLGGTLTAFTPGCPACTDLTFSSFRNCRRISNIPTTRIRIKISFNWSIDIFNLCGLCVASIIQHVV